MQSVDAAVQTGFGTPHEVVGFQENVEELPPPSGTEVLVAMRYSPINPADVNVLEGTYMSLPDSFPSIPGLEGSGEVLSLGPDAQGMGLLPGDAVFLNSWDPVAKWSPGGCWKTHVLVPHPDRLVKVSGDEETLQQASMMQANPPTAYGMLKCVHLRPGDWVIQNAGNSGVGCAVIALCKHWEHPCISVVRRRETAERLRDELGAEHVISEEDAEGVEGGVSTLILDLIKSLAPTLDHKPVVRLALNAVGGESAKQLARCLSPQGVHVTYGAMGRMPIVIPNPYLIFKGLSFRGFHLSYYYAEQDAEERGRMWALLTSLLESGQLRVRVEKVYPLKDVQLAVQHAWRPELLGLTKDGKILLNLGSATS